MRRLGLFAFAALALAGLGVVRHQLTQEDQLEVWGGVAQHQEGLSVGVQVASATDIPRFSPVKVGGVGPGGVLRTVAVSDAGYLFTMDSHPGCAAAQNVGRDAGLGGQFVFPHHSTVRISANVPLAYRTQPGFLPDAGLSATIYDDQLGAFTAQYLTLGDDATLPDGGALVSLLLETATLPDAGLALGYISLCQ